MAEQYEQEIEQILKDTADKASPASAGWRPGSKTKKNAEGRGALHACRAVLCAMRAQGPPLSMHCLARTNTQAHKQLKGMQQALNIPAAAICSPSKRGVSVISFDPGRPQVNFFKGKLDAANDERRMAELAKARQGIGGMGTGPATAARHERPPGMFLRAACGAYEAHSVKSHAGNLT